METNSDSKIFRKWWKSKNIVKDESAPLYYSKHVIDCFSIFFSTLFGAILLAINFKKINKKAIWQVALPPNFIHQPCIIIN